MIRLIDFIQKNSKVYLIVGILILVNIVCFSFFSFHEYKLYKNTSAALQNSNKNMKKAELNYKKINEKYKLVNKLKKRLKDFKNKDLKNETYFEKEMTKRIFNALNNNNINFQNLTYGEKEVLKGNIKKRSIHIPIKSSYVNFRKFIMDMETLPFPSMIEKISISSANSGEISATIEIASYYKRTKK